jgi:hypothetical protein
MFHLFHKFYSLVPEMFSSFEKRGQNLNTLAEKFGEVALAAWI